MSARQYSMSRDSARRAEQAFDAVLEQLIATCTCDACERYRKAFARRAGYYAARIEEALRANHARSTVGGASTRGTP